MENMLGVMIDCSRNAVLKVETVKQYADLLKKMGYNTLMLYTEDTYEVDGQPYFGHFRGRYSKAELKELDAYCTKIGIELVPCIQTLAHLNEMFKWRSEYESINDCDDILLIGEEKTYELIEAMLSTVSECFTSRKIHIGMDEAYRVGTGKYQRLHGIRDRFDVINEHLHRVCQITEKYGLEPMIWSDMFCKLALDIENQYADVDTSAILEKAKLPENISLVYWDYYSEDYDHYVKMIKTNKLFGRKVYFAGGAWTWRGMSPDNAFSMRTTEQALKACKDCGVDGTFFTVWGDDGAECPALAVLPSLMYAAEYKNGNADLELIKKKFYDVTDCEFDSFLLLDKLDTPGGKHHKNPSKYILYNDPFMGIRDCLCAPEDRAYYENLAEQIQSVQETGAFAHIFEAYEKLARVLAIKSTLGLRTREAYCNQDMAVLRQLVGEYDILLEKVKGFHAAHQKRWFRDNKPHGFDVQDLRLGGLMQRIVSCKNRLAEYVDGSIEHIPELEEPMLDQVNGYDGWARIATANVVSHIF